MDHAISVEKLEVRYGNYVAVHELSFDVKEGEIFIVIGPNGSGKTSTMECIEGLKKRYSGNISVLGLDPYGGRREMYRCVGIQLQETQYPDRLKVQELCELFASFYDSPADWKSLLHQFGLADKSKSYISKLSGGERQKLTIILALLPKPRLLVLDELTTGLDPEARRSLWNSLKAIKESGVAILLVSHYMDEVSYLADRLMLLQGGAAMFTGTVSQFREYAQEVLQDKYQADMSIEDIYLALAPATNAAEGRLVL